MWVNLKRIFFPLAGPSHRAMYEKNNIDYHQMERKHAGEAKRRILAFTSLFPFHLMIIYIIFAHTSPFNSSQKIQNCRTLLWLIAGKLSQVGLHHKLQNQTLHYTRCITPKRVTGLRCPSSRHSAKATELPAYRCWSGGEPFATLCKIWPAFDIRTLDLPHTKHTRYWSRDYDQLHS